MQYEEYREAVFRELRKLHWKNPQLVFQWKPEYNGVLLAGFITNKLVYSVSRMLNHKWQKSGFNMSNPCGLIDANSCIIK